MPACVIPFPARRPTDRQAQIDLIRAFVAQSWADPEAPRRPPVDGPAPGLREDEILKLLRRIDRRLAKMATV